MIPTFDFKSTISEHGDSKCCSTVQDWVDARDDVDRQFCSGPLPTPWIQATYSWGPTSWPFYWCDLTFAKSLDCGVFAALGQYVLERRGLRVARVQVVEYATESQVMRWTNLWQESDCDPSTWIVDDHSVYHEALAIVIEGVAVLFDPTENVVLGSRFYTGGAPQRMRLIERIDAKVLWGGQQVEVGTWREF